MQELRDILIEAAKLAGEIQKEIAKLGNDKFSLKNKYGETGAEAGADAVTIADIESEKALRAFFVKKMPEFNIFGEEFGASYNGNGKVIIIDPLDCTLSFKQGIPCWGPIIAVYENGKNIGSVEFNVMKNIMYVATEKTGFEHIGSEEDDIIQNGIYISGRFKDEDYERLIKIVQKEFPDGIIIPRKQNLFHKVRVYEGKYAFYFNQNIALHDIGASPLFGKLTNTLVTNSFGKPYDYMDAEKEVEIYNIGTKEAVYCKDILIAKPKNHAKILKVLKQFYNTKYVGNLPSSLVD